MKAKIIYFVLYLVVIAELLVVIHERDLLINELKMKQDVQKYIAVVKLDTLVNNEKFSVPSNEGSIYNVLYARNLVSIEEKNKLVLRGTRIAPAQSSESFLPEKISNIEPNGGKIKLVTKVHSPDVALFKFTSRWSDLPIKPNVGGSIPITYKIYGEVRRVLPSDLQLETVDKILYQIHLIGEKDASKYVDSIKFSYINGLSDSLMVKVLKKTKNPVTYKIDNFNITDFISSLSSLSDSDIENPQKCANILRPYRDAIKKYEFIKTNTVPVTIYLTQ